MPGTQRKSAPHKTAAKKATPRPAPKVEPAGESPEAFDLLDALGTEDRPPVDVTLLGVHASVRRSYTAEEDLKFTEYIRQYRMQDALLLIVGDDAEALWEKIDELSIEQGIKVMNRLANLSTLIEGEALALLPTSALGMAGALATHSSSGSTG